MMEDFWNKLTTGFGNLINPVQGVPPASTDPNSFYGPQMQQLQALGTSPGQALAPAGGYADITGDTPSGVRGDEVTDTADLAGYIIQGASRNYILREAKRRRYTLRDFNNVMGVQSASAQVATLLGLQPQGGVFPDQRFMVVMDILQRALRGRRRRHRGMGLTTIVKALHQASAIAHVLKVAGRGIARLSGASTHVSAPRAFHPARRYRSGQFTRMVSGRN